MILSLERVEKRTHLPGRSEAGLIQNVESGRVGGVIRTTSTNEVQLQSLGGNAFLLQSIARFACRSETFDTEAMLFRDLPQDAGSSRLRAAGRALQRDDLIADSLPVAYDLSGWHVRRSG